MLQAQPSKLLGLQRHAERISGFLCRSSGTRQLREQAILDENRTVSQVFILGFSPELGRCFALLCFYRPYWPLLPQTALNANRVRAPIALSALTTRQVNLSPHFSLSFPSPSPCLPFAVAICRLLFAGCCSPFTVRRVPFAVRRVPCVPVLTMRGFFCFCAMSIQHSSLSNQCAVHLEMGRG